MGSRFLIWDFDGTLGYRLGGWCAALSEAAKSHSPSHEIPADNFMPFLRSGFPWHTPDTICTAPRSADAWWEALEPLFASAFVGTGCSPEHGIGLAGCVRGAYLDMTAWRLYEDTIPSLQALSYLGWKHVILSNHVPELDQILEQLHLNKFIEQVFNSAVTGVEKPHPEAFQTVLRVIGSTGPVFMIGDNLLADIQGAERVGIPGVLVRRHHEATTNFHADLYRLTDAFRSGWRPDLS